MYDSIYAAGPDGRLVPLLSCLDCGSPWCVEGDTGYGTTNTCPDCGRSSYCDRGD